MNSLYSVSVSEGLYNCRIKLYPDGEGGWIPCEKMVVSSPTFNPLNLEKKDKYSSLLVSEVSADALENVSAVDVLPVEELCSSTDENLLRSCRRARSKLYDLIRCNLDMKYFVTLTFDDSIVDRCDYAAVVRRFSQWSDNCVRRNGYKYVAVAEYHKDKRGIHFHVICNDALPLVDSGTVSVPLKKKPIKIATADRYNIPLDDRKTVYNISSWKYGFSTAIAITADEGLVKVSQYLKKYLTKDNEKVGGRWYYSGGDLVRPRFEYCNEDFRDAECSYEFKVPGKNFKVLVY